MIRLIARYLALLILVGSVMDLHDLSKVPYLIEHYQQHKIKTEGFSLADFFTLHYGASADKHDKEEHEKHKGLPFKTHDCASVHSYIFMWNSELSELNFGASVLLNNNFYQSAFSSDFTQSIWQPPRLVS